MKELDMKPEEIANLVVLSREKHYAMIIPVDALYLVSKALKERDAQIAALTADNQNYSELLQYHIDRQAKAEAQLAELAKPEPATDEANHCASVLEYIGQFESEDIDSDTVDLRFEIDGVDTGSDVSITEYATRSAKVIRGLLSRAAPPAPVKLPKSQRLDGNGYGYYFDMNDVFVALDEAGIKYKTSDGSVAE